MVRLIVAFLLVTAAPASADSQWPNTERLALFKAISDKCSAGLEFPEKFYTDVLEPPFWRETEAAKLSMKEAFAKLDSMVAQVKPTIESISCDHLNMALRNLMRAAPQTTQ